MIPPEPLWRKACEGSPIAETPSRQTRFCYPVRIGQGMAMDDASKISLGIVGAAVAVFFCWVAYHEYERQRDIDEATAALAKLQAETPHYTQADVWVQPRAALKTAPVYRFASLEADEQCIAGTVVRVNGTTYVQVLAPDGQPEACAGRSRVTVR